MKFHENRTIITDSSHEYLRMFTIVSRSFLLRMRNVSDKICSEYRRAHFMFNIISSKIVPFMRKFGRIRSRQTGVNCNIVIVYIKEFFICLLLFYYITWKIHRK